MERAITECIREGILREFLEKNRREAKNVSIYEYDQDGNQKPSWDSLRMEQSRLGYNDVQQLIAFLWNTSSHTITPLWMAVDSGEMKWVPLFPRINK